MQFCVHDQCVDVTSVPPVAFPKLQISYKRATAQLAAHVCMAVCVCNALRAESAVLAVKDVQ